MNPIEILVSSTPGHDTTYHTNFLDPQQIPNMSACAQQFQVAPVEGMSGDVDTRGSDRKLRQKIKKREAARNRYYLQQQRFVDLERTVELSISRNEELRNKLDSLTKEQQRLAQREKELVAQQHQTSSELEAMRAQLKA
jgi:hypothetical protein